MHLKPFGALLSFLLRVLGPIDFQPSAGGHFGPIFEELTKSNAILANEDIHECSRIVYHMKANDL